MSTACPNATVARVPDMVTGGAGANARSPQRVPRARTSLTSCSARVVDTGARVFGGVCALAGARVLTDTGALAGVRVLADACELAGAWVLAGACEFAGALALADACRLAGAVSAVASTSQV